MASSCVSNDHQAVVTRCIYYAFTIYKMPKGVEIIKDFQIQSIWCEAILLKNIRIFLKWNQIWQFENGSNQYVIVPSGVKWNRIIAGIEISNCMNELIRIWVLFIKEKKGYQLPHFAFLNIASQMNLKDLHYFAESSHPGFLEVYHAL